jgi:hypothetical protein
MTLEDLGKYKSKIAGNFSPLGEANKGKGPLDPQEEYVFELVDGDLKKMKSGQSAEDKAAGKEPAKKDHAALTWKEIKSGILVFQHMQIEGLSWGKGPSDPFRSKAVKFVEDIGIPTVKDQIPNWGNIFIKTMKIRARVVQSTRGGNPVPDEYIFKEGSFGKYQV